MSLHCHYCDGILREDAPWMHWCKDMMWREMELPALMRVFDILENPPRRWYQFWR